MVQTQFQIKIQVSKVIMEGNILKTFWENIFWKMELCIKVFVITLHNKMG